jgi:Ni,Fe-hydrogenase III component G
MTPEETIQQQLGDRFEFLKDKIRVQRTRRIFAEVSADKFAEVFDYAVKQLNFDILCAITGLDEGAMLGVIYHLAHQCGITLNLKTSVPKENPNIQTILSYFPAAEVYEKELKDLLGINVEGLPPGTRYPLPDGWPEGQFPLRKDWTPEMLDKAVGKKE